MKSFIYSATRLLQFLSFAFVFLLRGLWAHWTVKDPIQRKKRFSYLEYWVQGLCCRSFGVKIKLINAPPPGAPGLIVGNHMGFIDILAIGGHRPMLFVTSQEMRETPFLGLLTEMGGCIYVERRNRSASQNELHNIIQSLQQGFNVCLFPEATSHDGSMVLPFKRTLMSAAAHAQVPIHPYVFNFRSIDGEKFHIKNRDKVCWYGDIPFVQSLMAAISLKSIECEIKFLDPFYPTLEMERSFVADEIQRRISAEFVPYSTD